jgi:hypothetical protein
LVCPLERRGILYGGVLQLKRCQTLKIFKHEIYIGSLK